MIPVVLAVKFLRLAKLAVQVWAADEPMDLDFLPNKSSLKVGRNIAKVTSLRLCFSVYNILKLFDALLKIIRKTADDCHFLEDFSVKDEQHSWKGLETDA